MTVGCRSPRPCALAQQPEPTDVRADTSPTLPAQTAREGKRLPCTAPNLVGCSALPWDSPSSPAPPQPGRPAAPRSLAQDTQASGALSEAECSGSAERRYVLPGPASMHPRPESQRGSCHERTPADPAAPTQPQAWLSPTVALGAWGMALTRSYRGASLRFHPPVNPPWRDLTALVRTGHLARGRDAPQGCSLASGASREQALPPHAASPCLRPPPFCSLVLRAPGA